jgi:hypothetical protein
VLAFFRTPPPPYNAVIFIAQLPDVDRLEWQRR